MAASGPATRATQLPSGVVTFGFTDIEGSTRLFASIGDRYRPILAQHNDIIRAALAHHDGVEIRTEGDSFFVAFTSATSAIAFAADVQRGCATATWPAGIEIRVRIGLHTGEAVPEGDDYISLVVHHASRVATAAHGGQTLVSGATVDAAGDLGSALHLRSLGAHRLRDVEDAVELFEVGGDGVPPGPGRTRAVPASAHGLAVPATPLVGRDSELAAVVSALRRERLVSIVGAGGTGKTRLAAAVAADVAPSVEGEAWIVALAELPIGAPMRAVASAVADVLGAPPAENPVDAIGATIGHRALLLVLDNCEHVIGATAELVEALLARCGGLRVLVTSRETLRVPGEAVTRLVPLAVPTDVDADPATLIASAAVRLFLDRARAANAAVVADAATVTAAATVARAVEGIPLALELAAARCAALTPAQVADRIGDALSLLKGGARTAAPRQRALRATLEWSHDLLTPEEQAVFRRLAVLPASFPLEVAEVAAGFDPIDSTDMLDHVQSLVAQSLLEPEGGRFRFLVPVRTFALEALRSAGEEDETFEALTAGLAERFERIADHARRQRDVAARAPLDQLVDGVGEPALLAVVGRGAARRDHRVAAIAHDAFPRLWQTARFRTARALVDAALPLDAAPRLRALLRFDAILLSGYDGVGADSVERLTEEGLAAAADAGDDEAELRASLLHALADHVADTDLEHALALYQEAADIAEAAGDVRQWAIRTRAIVRNKVNAGLPADATRILQTQVIPALEATGDEYELARTKANLADVVDWEHRGRAAIAWREAADAMRVSAPNDLPFAVAEVAASSMAVGRLRDAIPLADEAVELQRAAGGATAHIVALRETIRALVGDHEAVARVLASARGTGFFQPTGFLADAGHVDQARALWDGEGRTDHPFGQMSLARLRLAEGDADGALAALDLAAPPAQPVPVAEFATVRARARLRTAGADAGAVGEAMAALRGLVEVGDWPMVAHLLVDIAHHALTPPADTDVRRAVATWLRETGHEAYLDAWGLADLAPPAHTPVPGGTSWDDATAALRAAAEALPDWRQ